MRSIVLFVAGTIFSTFAHSADDSVRSALISRIEVLYLSAAMIRSDSPVVDQLLAGARTLNPDADSATWADVKTDVATALTLTLTGKGSALEAFFRSALDTLSNAELKRLSSLLNNPVYKKFQGEMSKADNQKRMMQAFMGE